MAEQIALNFDAPAPPLSRDPREDGHRAAERAGRAADPEWMTAAAQAVETVARRLPEFTTDDVWAELSKTTAETPEGRAMGAVMRAAQKNRVAVPIKDRYKPSIRPDCHGRPVRVWRSLMVGAGALTLAG